MSHPRLTLTEVLHPWPRQREFLAAADTFEYTLFGGAAGPGKSYILRWWLVRLLLRWAKQGLRGVRVGLFCEDYPTLNDRHLSRVRFEFPAWLGKLNEQAREFRLWPHYGSGVLAFRNLDRPEKYQSSEFAAIAVDELTQNGPEVFNTLRARKRWPGVDFSPFAAATNPGGSGHVWVKKLWIDRDFSGDDGNLDPTTFAFVPAKVGDNPALPDSYLATLESLPKKMRQAFLEGDWNIFVGQYFDEWSEAAHVCPPFPIPKDWVRWRAVDWGYAAPWCCLWLARDPKTLRVYVYRELYERGVVDSVQARKIQAFSEGERIEFTVADPALWGVQPNGTTIAQTYATYGVPLVQANNDRYAGWQTVRRVLMTENGPPTLQVFATCLNVIRTLPGLVHDRIKVEDIDTEGEDHAADTLRYGLMPTQSPEHRPLAARFG